MRSAWWLARWLVLLVITFDLLSSPFHHHRHDEGESQFELAETQAQWHDSSAQAKSDSHALASHATQAIRIDSSRVGQLPALDSAECCIAVVSAAQLVTEVDELPSTAWRQGRLLLDFRSHRSLPPACRAPPLHA